MKDMLFYVIQQHGRQWHRVIPLAVAKRNDWSLAVHVGLRASAAWTTGGAERVVDRPRWTDSADLGKPVEIYTRKIVGSVRCV